MSKIICFKIWFIRFLKVFNWNLDISINNFKKSWIFETLKVNIRYWFLKYEMKIINDFYNCMKYYKN